ncbi:MAG: glycosyltransferase [Vicinamibacterales bacterium]
MRVLIAAHGYPPTHAHGAERRAERTARALIELGHDVEVLAVERVDSARLFRDTSRQDGVPVHRLYYDVTPGDRWRNLYDHPFVGEACREVIRSRPFDVVHVISGYLLGRQVVDAAKAYDARVVITLTEFWFLCARLNLLRRTGAICTGPGAEKCARCLAEERRRFRLPAQYAPQVADALWAMGGWLPSRRAAVAATSRRIEVLSDALACADLIISPSQFLIDLFRRNGADVTKFRHMRQGVQGPPPSAPAPVDGATLRLGYVGQMKEHKGVDLAVTAVARLVGEGLPVTLDVWGDESDDPAYARRLHLVGDRVTAIRWLGRTPEDSPWTALSSIDVLVVPSRWYENSPNVILEAFAMGVAVVATNLGGMAELVADGANGLLFPLNDVDGLCGILRGLVRDRSLLGRCRTRPSAVRSIADEVRDLADAYVGLGAAPPAAGA